MSKRIFLVRKVYNINFISPPNGVNSLVLVLVNDCLVHGFNVVWFALVMVMVTVSVMATRECSPVSLLSLNGVYPSTKVSHFVKKNELLKDYVFAHLQAKHVLLPLR